MGARWMTKPSMGRQESQHDPRARHSRISVARARARDFQARHGEGFWDHGTGEVEAYAKPIEAEKINKGEKHHV